MNKFENPNITVCSVIIQNRTGNWMGLTLPISIFILHYLSVFLFREIDSAERSILRRICEKDDASTRSMILLVSSISNDTIQVIIYFLYAGYEWIEGIIFR